MKIFFSVGEPSGDLHGANLIHELRRQRSDVEFVGFGGPRMAAAGCQVLEDLTRLAVMWFLRALLNLHHFVRMLRRANRYFQEHRPDAVVLIDYPGFNWWIARSAKRRDIPVFYYGTPQMWAWAPWRVRKMRRYVDHVLCKLPFEEDWYRERGCHATYVGHPYFDEMHRQQLDAQFLSRISEGSSEFVTMLPGSRTQEVTSNLPTFLKAAERVREQVPQARFAIAAFNDQQADIVRQEIQATKLPVEIHVAKTAELIHRATCCMACSGSVSLELLYHEKPTVILYRISRLAFHAQRLMRRVKYITLVNLLASKNPFPDDLSTYDPDRPDAEPVPFPEYLTHRDVSAKIAQHIVKWLTDSEQRAVCVGQLCELKGRFAHPGASTKAATYILNALSDSSQAPPQPVAA